MTRPLLVAFLLIAIPASAANEPQRGDVESAARAIYGAFMSPYCPGLLLADCPSSAAVELRREIRERLEAGQSEDDVRELLEAQFGEKLLAAPPPRGWGLLAWVVPFVAIGVGLAGTLLWIQAHRTPPMAKPRTATAVDPALRARLEDELRLFDRGT